MYEENWLKIVDLMWNWTDCRYKKEKAGFLEILIVMEVIEY